MAMIQSGLRRSWGGDAATSSFAAERGSPADGTAIVVGRGAELDLAAKELGLDGSWSAGSKFIASVSAGARRARLPPLSRTGSRERVASAFRGVRAVFQP